MLSSKSISIKEAADELGVSEQHFYSLLRNGHVKGATKVGDKWVIDRVTFNVWRFLELNWDDSYLEVIKLTKLLCKNGGK